MESIAKNRKNNNTKEVQGKNRDAKIWASLSDETTKRLNWTLSIISLVTGAIILIIGFLPAAQVEGVSLGNYYINSLDWIKYNLRNIKFLKIEYEESLLWGNIISNLHFVTVICLVMGAILFLQGIEMLWKCLKEKRPLLINAKPGKIGIALGLLVEISFITSIFLYIKLYEELFVLDFKWQRVVLLLVVIKVIASAFIKLFYAHKSEKVSDSSACKMIYTKQTHKELRIKMPVANLICIVVITVALVSGLTTENYYGIINKDKLSDMKLAYIPEEYSLFGDIVEVGKKAPNEDYTIKMFDVDIASINYSKRESWSLEWERNYYFYNQVIERKKDEIKELMPEQVEEDGNWEDVEENLNEYIEKIEHIEKEIEVLESNVEKLPVTEESYRRDESNVIVEYIFNTNRIDKEKHKFGTVDLNILCMGKESVVIDNTEFEEGTDFSKVKIIATVKYVDGSIKESFITPENYDDLNNAASGKHIIKWSDSWGDYTAEITIK